MTKKPFRRRSFRRKIKRHIKKYRPPIEVGIAGAATVFTPPRTGWGSPMQHIQDNHPELVLQDYAQGLAGITLPMNDQPFEFNILSTLNPFDFESARYTKMMLWSAFGGTIRKKLIKGSSGFIQKIPIIGRMFS